MSAFRSHFRGNPADDLDRLHTASYDNGVDSYSEECFYDIHGNLLSRGGTKPGADLRFSVTPDLNGDGVVNEQDLHRMELGSEDGIQDMNGDGEVNIADILHQVCNARRLAPLEDPPGDNQLPDWEHDDFGNTVQTPDGQTMAYDDWGRLEHYGKDGVNDHHIAYDAHGKRFATWNDDQPGTTQYTVFNESGKPLAVYQWDGFDFTLKKEHYYLGSRHIASDIWDAQAGCPQRVYLHADHLGSARQYSDDTGVFIGFKDYHAFGDEWDKDLTCLPITTDFTGHQTMGGTDLIWMQARTYSPHYGRFLEPDPVRLTNSRLKNPQQLGLYGYAENRPVIFRDPSGMIVNVDECSLDYIRGGLPDDMRDFVQLDDNGNIDAELMKSVVHVTDDANFNELAHMASVDETVAVRSGNRIEGIDNDGSSMERSFITINLGEENEWGFEKFIENGYTLVPGEESVYLTPMQSSNDGVQIYLNDDDQIPREEKAKTMAHELFGHGFRWMTGDPDWKDEAYPTNEVESRTDQNIQKPE